MVVPLSFSAGGDLFLYTKAFLSKPSFHPFRRLIQDFAQAYPRLIVGFT